MQVAHRHIHKLSGVTGGLAVAKVFCVLGLAGAQRLERCRIRVVSSLT